MARQRAIRAGRAYVELNADDSKLKAGLRKAQMRLRAFGRTVNSIGLRLGAMGAAITGPLLAATGVFASAGDELDKMSARTGIGVARLQELGFAAQQSGSDLNTLAKIVQRMNRRLGRGFAEGTSSEIEAMEQLGLDIERLRQMDPEGRLLAIADAMANYGDNAAAAGLAQRAFGAQVDAMLPMLLEGRDGIEQMAARARELGIGLSGKDSRAAADFTNRLGELRAVLKQVTLEIGAAVADALSKWVTAVAEGVSKAAAFIREHRRMVAWVLALGGALIAGAGGLLALGLAAKVAAFAVGGLIGIVSVATTVVGGLITALGLLVTVKGAVIGTIIGVGVAMLNMTGIGQRALQWLGERFTWLWKHVREVVGAIADALRGGDISAAVNVLWTSLRLAWLNGTLQLQEIWHGMLRAINSTWIDALAGLKMAWAKFVAKVKTLTQSSIQAGMEAVIRVEGFLDDSLNVKKMLGKVRAEGESDKESIADDLATSLKEIEKDRRESQREADSALNARTREAEKALGKARAEWRAALREARELGDAAAEPFAPDGGVSGTTGDLMDAARGASQAGLFNIRALAGLQTSADDKVVRELRQHTQQNRELIRLAREQGMVFGN